MQFCITNQEHESKSDHDNGQIIQTPDVIPGENFQKTYMGTRSGSENESEPNNDISSAITSSNELHNTKDMNGNLKYNTDEIDFFFINLIGGGQPSIQRLNITPEFSDPIYINKKAVGLKLKMYTEFQSELYMLEYKALGSERAIKDHSYIPWENATSIFINADRTGRYYFEVAAEYIINTTSHEVINPNALINYTLHVTITPYSYTDKNNDIGNSTALTGPIDGLALSQADDHWDWYCFDSLTPNRAVNISLRLRIKTAYQSGYSDGKLYVVKVTCILKCYDLAKSEDVELRVHGDQKGVYHSNPIQIYLNSTFNKAYLGVYIQQRVYDNNIELDKVGCGKSNITYKIVAFDLALVNTKPKLLQPSVSPKEGNLRDSYEFKIIYQDDDNDAPWYVNLELDDLLFNMSISSDLTNDGDFTNGELYEIILKSSDFPVISHNKYTVITYKFSTYDYFSELSVALSNVNTLIYSDLKIIDNVNPTLRENLPSQWIIKEDSKPVYIKLLKKIFFDPDDGKYTGKEVFLHVWSDLYTWTNITDSDNVTVRIMNDDTLELVPKHNRFGTDTFKLRAYDVEGVINAITYDFKLQIDPVNDAPILAQPPNYLGDGAKLEDGFCNITFVADDSADGNEDILFFSTDILEKIPDLAKDPDKYRYKFSNYTGKLSFIPDNDMVGIYKINVSVKDQGNIEPIGLSDIKEFTLEIKNVNDPPVAVITYPADNSKFNTSSIIALSGENSTDSDFIHGESLKYYWYILENGTDEILIGGFNIPTSETQIKKAGYHKIKLKVKDREGATDETMIDIRIITLVGDIPGGDDTDEDGIPDLWELRYDMDTEKFDSDQDPDNDSYSNLEEYLGEDKIPGGDDSSNPKDPNSIPGDLDADSMPDSWEREVFGSLFQDRDGDPDGDQYTNYEEYLGPDKIPGNDDWSHPLNGSDKPLFKKTAKQDDGIDVGNILIIASVVIVIVILLLIFYMFIAKKRKIKKEAEDREKSKGKPIYTPEPQPTPMMVLPTPGVPQTPSQTIQAQNLASGPMPVAQPMMPMQFPMQPLPPLPGQQPPLPGQQPPLMSTPQLTMPQQATQQQVRLALPKSGQIINPDNEDIEKK